MISDKKFEVRHCLKNFKTKKETKKQIFQGDNLLANSSKIFSLL